MTMRLPIALVLALLAAFAGFAVARAARLAALNDRSFTDPAHALCDWLKVAPENRQAILEHDPRFASDLHTLRAELTRSRETLAETFDRSDVSDDEMRAASEAFINASAGLERRVTDYLVSVRHHLTPEQQRKLFSLCAEGARLGRCWQCRCGKTDDRGQANGGAGRGHGAGKK